MFNRSLFLCKVSCFIEVDLFRATLDVNREINEAAQNCPNAMAAFNSYHGQISSVISTFNQGKALLFDIHGQVRLADYQKLQALPIIPIIKATN